MINIEQILRDHNIPLDDHGKNVVKNHVNISCVYCNETTNPDHSKHLGIDLDTLEWCCWRNRTHAGKSIFKLLKKLGIYIDPSLDKTELERVASHVDKVIEMTAPVKTTVHVKCYNLPDYFSPIKNDLVGRQYLNYLKYRGFADPEKAVLQFDLCRSTFNAPPKYHDRIIIPTYLKNRVTWTSRSVKELGEFSRVPKYLSAALNEADNIKDTIYDYNSLVTDNNWGTLLIVEGPLDVMKWNYFAPSSIRSAAIFGVMISENQIELIKSIWKERKVFIVLDNTAAFEAMHVAKALDFCNPKILVLKQKDFGGMNYTEINEFIKELY